MTIRLVSHFCIKDSISLEGKSALANPKPDFAERNRQWNINRYERRFWQRLSLDNSAELLELDRLEKMWFSKGKLELAVDKPHLYCHGDVVCQYLQWQIQRKGGVVTIVKPADAPQTNRVYIERQEHFRYTNSRQFSSVRF